MTARRLPRPSALSELLAFRRPTWNPTARRLARAHTIADLRDIARRVTPKGPFDYTEGAAEAELSLARARQAFLDIEFHPAILRDVSTVDTSCTVAGGPSALPFGIALEEHGRIVLGLATSPAQDRRWWARRGEGAFTGS
ncbi:MAG: alpha-hydroxy-acid oxidizing protein, partial [Actinomycetes bacterium]